MISLGALIFHELFADFDIVTEIALVAIRATAVVLKFIARLYFASIMDIWTCLSAFSMDELFADPVFSQLVWIRYDGLVLIDISSVV